MRQITIETLANFAHCNVIGNGQYVVERLVFDSRKTFIPDQTLFVAIKSDHNDGHNYIDELYDKAIRAFIVEKQAHINYALYPDATFLECSNTIVCLQSMAVQIRQNYSCPFVGITGSNGKTIVKEWLARLLECQFKIGRSPRSFNSQMGVPLSIWMLPKTIDFALIEAGVSQVGEMDKLGVCIQPDYGILTNIGPAHQENFKSLEQKLEEKLKLFKTAHTLFIHEDEHILSTLQRVYPDKKVRVCGSSASAHLQLCKQTVLTSGCKLDLCWNNADLTVQIPFTDPISIDNALLCILAALELGVEYGYLKEALPELQPIAMRLEQKEGINNCLLIDDAYNSDLTSLELALDFLNQMGAKRGLSKTLILSDIYQSGMSSTALIQKINQLVQEKGVNKLIGIGSQMVEALGSKQAYRSTDDFIKAVHVNQFKNEAILLKGSRRFSFERISALLEQRRHKTVLEINMNALGENVQFFRSQLKRKTKLLAMVKAFSYGSGSFEIANLLQHQQVDYLGVAFADEGIELREAGITLPIIVMNPELSSFPLMLQYDLEPEIYSFDVLKAFENAVQRQGLSDVPVHIKVDTGMNRLGFLPEELDELICQLKGSSSLKVISAFSHLAGSDEIVHDDFTKQQIKAFEASCKRLKQGLGYGFMRHILNSAGIERFTAAQYEMVRLGIGMYGVSATQNTALQPVVTLKSYVPQLKVIKAGATIGYGRIGTADREMKIAIIPIGYADGFNRRLSNGVGQVMIHGQLAPVVGNICMDMCMVDVTGIATSEGDEVEIFGAYNSIGNMAKALGTIPYEILTSISRRVKRVYVME